MVNGRVAVSMTLHHDFNGGGLLASISLLSFGPVSYVSPGCALFVDDGAAVVAMVASPWALAVMRVSRGVTVVACSCRVVVAMVVVISCRGDHLFAVVVVLFPLWRNTEAHFEWARSTRQMYGLVIE